MKKTKKLTLISVLLVIVLAAAVLVWQGTADKSDLADGEIRNIIVMIPDGGGFGNYDIAEALKLSDKGMAGLQTELTNKAISREKVEGLYLSNYLIGTSRTRSASSSVTDSAAGGTAIATGYRTNNDMVAISPETSAPMATLLEASQLAGKSTGIVCTKFWYDATPADFTSHAVSREDYQQITEQMLHRGLDIVLGGGHATSYEGDISAADLGYTLVTNKTEMEKAVKSGEAKIWSSFTDTVDGSVSYDYKIGTENPGHPTLLDMTKAAITALSENTENENGFFLMVEGSRVDSGGHNSNLQQVTSEYLAFDEAFAYAVNWAKKDGRTLVVGVPDHDTGGLTLSDEEKAIQSLAEGKQYSNCSWGGFGNHTGQNVPIWAYGPESAVKTLLEAMGLPEGGAEKARTGKYYKGVEFNEDYAVDNTALAGGVSAVVGFDLDQVTETLFVDVTDLGTYEDGVFTATQTGIRIPAYDGYYLQPDGTQKDFPHGISIWVAERFYVPAAIAELCKG